MTEPTVSIPLSLAKVALKACECMEYISAAEKIEDAIANAALTQASALTQDQYNDTVNPLVRSDNG